MGARTEAYVDTSAFIAFSDRSDSFHDLFRRLFSDPPRLVTTTLVVAEIHGWFLRRYDRYRALQSMTLVESLKPFEDDVHQLQLGVKEGTDDLAGDGG